MIKHFLIFIQVWWSSSSRRIDMSFSIYFIFCLNFKVLINHLIICFRFGAPASRANIAPTLFPTSTLLGKEPVSSPLKARSGLPSTMSTPLMNDFMIRPPSGFTSNTSSCSSLNFELAKESGLRHNMRDLRVCANWCTETLQMQASVGLYHVVCRT